MTDRIKRNMQAYKPMTLISIRLPEHVIDDLKEVAPRLGFGGYQALIRAYISNGLRKHLGEMEAERVHDHAVEEFSRRLMAHGVPAEAIEEAAAEMRVYVEPVPCVGSAPLHPVDPAEPEILSRPSYELPGRRLGAPSLHLGRPKNRT